MKVVLFIAYFIAAIMMTIRGKCPESVGSRRFESMEDYVFDFIQPCMYIMPEHTSDLN